MARTINVFTFAAIAVWSLLSLGAWAVFSFGGDLVHAQLDWIFLGDPDAVPVASGIFRFLQTLGLGLIAFVWGAGALLLWLTGFVLRRLVRSATVVTVRAPEWTGAGPDDPYGERPMKDVTPPKQMRALPRE
jgi:hypothetical protein